MDLVFVILGFLLMLAGILGSILPVLPGVPISWLGLLMIYLAPSVPFDWVFLSITFVLAALLYLLDYIIPAIGTKRFGGSRYGMIGATLGLLAGLFFPPFGFIIGPFIGAFIGELLNIKTRHNALRAAFGSFVGLLASVFMKLVATFAYLGLFIYKVWAYSDVLF
jgi:uncharacterized protein